MGLAAILLIIYKIHADHIRNVPIYLSLKKNRKLRSLEFALLNSFLIIFLGSANAYAAPPVHYATCSYYGYYPYTSGSYTAAIACADNWVETGWRVCPSCRVSFSYSLDGHPWPYNGGHIYVYICENGTLHDKASNECVPEIYTLVVPDEAPPPQQCAGNPIDVATGLKLQHELDVVSAGTGHVGLSRYYSIDSNGKGSWQFNYQQSLHIVDSAKMRSPNPAQRIGASEASKSYGTKADACTLGWSEVKSRLSASWAQDTTAELAGDICQISKGGRVVRNLPVVKGKNPTPPPMFVRLVRVNGAIISYQKNDASWISLGAIAGRLEQINIDNILWRYTTKAGEIEDYNANGKLLSITASNGMKQELFYDANTGLLSRVEDSTGRELVFAYSGNQISSVTVDGDKVTNYTYNTLGLLTQVTRPDNSTRIYHYENINFPTALTGITDERGVRYATWTYDAQGRAISSEHAGGTDKTLLAFNADGSTTVTNPLGKQTTYRFDDIAGARRVTQVEGHATPSCEGANQNYTYTPEGWIESKTDWKGNTTTYSYNTLGQEISRTEASGTPQARTITTEWHPDLYVKTRVIDGGRETLYTYDDNGRLLSTATNPLPIQ